MNLLTRQKIKRTVSAGCHINDVMNRNSEERIQCTVSAGCHINDVMNIGIQGAGL